MNKKEQAFQELSGIFAIIRQKFTDQSDMDWVPYHTAAEVREAIDSHLEEFHRLDANGLDNAYILFIPTGSFQEHAMQNGWTDEYMKLASRFDKLYALLRNRR